MLKNVLSRKDFEDPEKANVYFVCMNHETPVRMQIMEGKNKFYACPRYFFKDVSHPDGHGLDEPACANRVSMTDAYGIYNLYSSKLEEEMAGGNAAATLTNWQFSYNGCECTVLVDKPSKLVIGVLNTRTVW